MNAESVLKAAAVREGLPVRKVLLARRGRLVRPVLRDRKDLRALRGLLVPLVPPVLRVLLVPLVPSVLRALKALRVLLVPLVPPVLRGLKALRVRLVTSVRAPGPSLRGRGLPRLPAGLEGSRLPVGATSPMATAKWTFL